MSCEELKELYELYALGALESAERAEMDEHLARHCPNCSAGVRQARGLVVSIALASPEVQPPKRLRERVVRAVSPVSQKSAGWNWFTHAWATATLVMLAAVVWYADNSRALQIRIADSSMRLRDVQAHNRLLSDALALVNLPDSRQLVFGTTDREPPRGRIFVHPERGVVLLASRLPSAPAGKVYEMWLIPKGGAPMPAGLFNSSERGEAMHVWNQRVDPGSTIAVTLEPEGGVQAPTSKPVIAAAF